LSNAAIQDKELQKAIEKAKKASELAAAAAITKLTCTLNYTLLEQQIHLIVSFFFRTNIVESAQKLIDESTPSSSTAVPAAPVATTAPETSSQNSTEAHHPPLPSKPPPPLPGELFVHYIE